MKRKQKGGKGKRKKLILGKIGSTVNWLSVKGNFDLYNLVVSKLFAFVFSDLNVHTCVKLIIIQNNIFVSI